MSDADAAEAPGGAGAAPQSSELGPLDQRTAEFEAAAASVADRAAWEALRVQWIGRKQGLLRSLLDDIKTVEPAGRKAYGEAVNRLKVRVESRLEELEAGLVARERAAAQAALAVDVTLPGRRPFLGNVHPVTLVNWEMEAIFAELGFSVAEGPEAEDDFHNFEALNFPHDHPARDTQDTFFLENGLLLRTHTSPVQIRTMLSRKPPIRVICPGRVYRCDNDLRHSPMFHQVEGLAIAEGITVGHLKGTLLAFMKRLFSPETEIRLRPSFFPFTEPSAEVDVTCQNCKGQGCEVCSGTGWMEILGCGMVDPRVLAACGIDPDRYSGFAFGMGVDRVAMNRYGIPNIRLLFDNDERLLRQVKGLMEFSLRWLAEYVNLPVGPDGPQRLAQRLTSAGFAVDGLHACATDSDDTVIDIDVTTNRPDAMNHLGLAREIAVLFDLPLRRPPAAPVEGSERVESAARVEIDDFAGCPRYTARVVRGVKVGESPAWLKARLQAIGLRPISNVVDITNFILWEMGQPLHAFDLHKLAGAKIVVRRANPGETLVTLDGVLRKLDPDMLVIADAERAVALGGVMGGLDSEVTASSVDILLECAHFDRKVVRRTARRLGMHTDASHRYERGADPEICAEAVSRAAQLIAEIAGGTVLSGVLDVRAIDRTWQRQGRVELAKLNAFAGVAIPRASAERWLQGLGFGLEPEDSEEKGEAVTWKVTVPSWRYYDFDPRPSGEIYPADVYEEVIRVHGFDAIPAALPAIAGADASRAESQIRRERVRRLLAASGYTEAIHFAFLDPEAEASLPNLAPAGADGAVGAALRLANPLSEQYSVLRRTLLPNLVETARFNQRRGAPSVRLFEVATVFFAAGAGGAALPDQPEQVALVCGGKVGSPWQREVELDLFDLKGGLENLFEAFGVRIEVRAAELPGLLAGSAAQLVRDGQVVGTLGRVQAEEGYPLYVAELALEALAGGDLALQVDVPSRFPGIATDLTFTHPLAVTWGEIEAAIRELATGDLVAHTLKVRYRGQGVPEGAVNTTISFLYQARERSLTQDEVNEHHFALGRELEQRFGWKG